MVTFGLGLICCVGLADGPAFAAALAKAPPAASPVFGIRAALFDQTTLVDGHFSYALRPRSKVSDAIDLINYSDLPVTLSVYPADIIETSRGALAPSQAGQPTTGVAAWVRLSTRALTLGPHALAKDAFSVRVPPYIAPGTYTGAIVAALSSLPKHQGNLSVQTRLALLVQVTVPGEVHMGVTLGTLQSSRLGATELFKLAVHNTGNVLYDLNGSVSVRDGSKHADLPLSPSGLYVIPGGTANITGVWSHLPVLGEAVAQATLRVSLPGRGDAVFHSNRVSLLFVPIRDLSVAGGILGCAGAAWVATTTKRRAYGDRRRRERQVLRDYRRNQRPRHSTNRFHPDLKVQCMSGQESHTVIRTKQ
jgi:hypothetical protein